MNDVVLSQSDTVTEAPLDRSPLLYSAARETFAKRFAELGPIIYVAENSGGNPAARFLSGLTENWRQEYTCVACANFMRQAANFVFINDEGLLVSALWDERAVPPQYHDAVKALRVEAEGGVVSEMITLGKYDEYSKAGNLTRRFNGTFGYESKGGFNHFSLTLPELAIAKANANKSSAERIKQLRTNVFEHAQLPALRTALAFLESGQLMRKDKYVPWVQWLIGVTEFAQTEKNSTLKRNYLAKAATEAPVGWVEYRASMVGTLLDELTGATDSDVPFIIARFNERADPINYQRAKSEASEGNIRAGAKALADAGLESALHRRWAMLSDAQQHAAWLPKASTAKGATTERATGTVFDKLLPKAEAEPTLGLKVPDTVMSYPRFVREVLPLAEKLEWQTGYQIHIGGFTTQEKDDARPLMKWDSLEARNPFCHFIMRELVAAYTLRLDPGRWVNVRGVFHTAEHLLTHDKQLPMYLAIEGVRFPELNSHALFAEAIKSELFPFRKTIEQYSNSTPLPDMPDENKLILASIAPATRLRVSVGDRVTTYQISHVKD